MVATKMVLNALYYTGLPAVSRRWVGGIGSIFVLHRVSNQEEKAFSPNFHLAVSPKFLERQLRELIDAGVEFVSMDEALNRISSYREQLNKRPFISVTLDDGYKDNRENAVPVFQKLNVPYTIYIAPGLVDGSSFIWWEDLERIIASRDTLYVDLPKGREEIDVSTPEKKQREFDALVDFLTLQAGERQHMTLVRDLAAVCGIDVQAYCKDQIMGWKELVELNRDPLCTIGAHTITHCWLSRLSREQARAEMLESARIIEAELGQFPVHFAYPYGMKAAASVREFEIARELGFRSAVTTRHGVIYPEHQNYCTALPRVSLNGKFQAARYTSTLMSGIPTLINNKGRRLNVG